MNIVSSKGKWGSEEGSCGRNRLYDSFQVKHRRVRQRMLQRFKTLPAYAKERMLSVPSVCLSMEKGRLKAF